MITDKILITAPVDTESGYGHKSREIVDAVLSKYDDLVDLAFLPWGSCSKNALLKSDRYRYILSKKKEISLSGQPSVHIHVGLPTEFEPRGAKNILFTSGVETDRISLDFIDHINKKQIDIVVVPSTFVRDVIVNTEYTHKSTGEKYRVTKEVIVIPESFPPEFITETCSEEFKLKFDTMIADAPEKLFFTAGQIVPKLEIFDDRKNITETLRNFVRTFRGNKHVGLLLKANHIDSSNVSRFEMSNYINMVLDSTGIDKTERPPIYLLFGDLSDSELYYVMSHDKVFAHAYFTHGEGFGRFILQSTLIDKPLIIPRVGGHRDFTSGKKVRMVNGEYKQIPPSAHMGNILIPDSKWFHVSDSEFYDNLYYVYKNYKDMQDKGKLKEKNLETYDLKNIQSAIIDLVEKYHVKEVKLNLSDLTPNLNIPKIQKVNG
jgi:hypothetical protein